MQKHIYILSQNQIDAGLFYFKILITNGWFIWREKWKEK